MLAQDEALIRATWAMAAADAPAIEAEFMRRVCHVAPHLCTMLRGIAPGEFDERAQHLVAAIVAALDEPRVLVRLLRDVARSQVGAQLAEDDYRLLGVCFFSALEVVLGPRLAPAARDACHETVTLLAALMRRVASSKRAPAA